MWKEKSFLNAFIPSTNLLFVSFFMEINWALNSAFVDLVMSFAFVAHLILNWNGNENETGSVCDAK